MVCIAAFIILAILGIFVAAISIFKPKVGKAYLKAMKKAQKAAEKAQKAALKEAPRYRSLHYIDEDDYDELPTIKTQNNTKKQTGGIEPPEIKD